MLTCGSPKKLWFGAACAVSVLTAPSSAKAVEVRLRSDEPGLHYTLVALEGGWAAGCEGTCKLTPPEGQYWLWVSGKPGSGVRLSRRKVTLVEDSHLTIRPAYKTPFIVGLVLGVTGSALIPASFVIAWNGYTAPSPWLWRGVLVGCATSAAGWALFGSNLKPSVEISGVRGRASSLSLSGSF